MGSLHQHLGMATITVGIDTSRVYNRKTPPGGKVSDAFSFNSTDTVAKKPQKIDRQRSSIDIGGGEKEAAETGLERQLSAPAAKTTPQKDLSSKQDSAAANTPDQTKSDITPTKSIPNDSEC